MKRSLEKAKELAEAYYRLGSLDKVARTYNCGLETVRRHLHDIGVNTAWPRKVTDERLVELRAGGCSQRDISFIVGMTLDCVRNRLRRLGI